MDKYLITYTVDGKPIAQEATIEQVATLVGMSDCTGLEGFSCYRMNVSEDGYVDLEKLVIMQGGCIDNEVGKWIIAPCKVFLTDKKTNEIVDSAEYPDH